MKMYQFVFDNKPSQDFYLAVFIEKQLQGKEVIFNTLTYLHNS